MTSTSTSTAPTCDGEPIAPICGDDTSGPTGVLTEVARRPGGVLVRGWVRDEAAAGPIMVRLDVNEQPAATVAATVPWADGRVGFEAVLTTTSSGTGHGAGRRPRRRGR
jgi:hypothetical protein